MHPADVPGRTVQHLTVGQAALSSRCNGSEERPVCGMFAQAVTALPLSTRRSAKDGVSPARSERRVVGVAQTEELRRRHRRDADGSRSAPGKEGRGFRAFIKRRNRLVNSAPLIPSSV
jgi:hypothetical protein